MAKKTLTAEQLRRKRTKDSEYMRTKMRMLNFRLPKRYQEIFDLFDQQENKTQFFIEMCYNYINTHKATTTPTTTQEQKEIPNKFNYLQSTYIIEDNDFNQQTELDFRVSFTNKNEFEKYAIANLINYIRGVNRISTDCVVVLQEELFDEDGESVEIDHYKMSFDLKAQNVQWLFDRLEERVYEIEEEEIHTPAEYELLDYFHDKNHRQLTVDQFNNLLARAEFNDSLDNEAQLELLNRLLEHSIRIVDPQY